METSIIISISTWLNDTKKKRFDLVFKNEKNKLNTNVSISSVSDYEGKGVYDCDFFVMIIILIDLKYKNPIVFFLKVYDNVKRIIKMK
jgi:hypothetical protein